MTSGYAQAHAGPDGANVSCMTKLLNRYRENGRLIVTSDSEELLTRFRNDPDWYLKYRKTVEMEMSDFMAWHKNTPGALAAQEVLRSKNS